MLAPVPDQLSKTIETLYRSESGRVLATLVRLLGDLDLVGAPVAGGAQDRRQQAGFGLGSRESELRTSGAYSAPRFPELATTT
jgi:hypothetical protein